MNARETVMKDKEEVIVAKDVGVYFDTDSNQNDYKSRLINVFKREKETETEKREKKFWSLKEISFTGHKGEILGIIGTNGAGKTTLSKVITGIIKEDRGDIHVDGKVTDLFSLGMGSNKEITVRENDYLNVLKLCIKRELIN